MAGGDLSSGGEHTLPESWASPRDLLVLSQILIDRSFRRFYHRSQYESDEMTRLMSCDLRTALHCLQDIDHLTLVQFLSSEPSLWSLDHGRALHGLFRKETAIIVLCTPLFYLLFPLNE